MKLLIVTSLYSEVKYGYDMMYMYMYCYFIIQMKVFVHQAASYNKLMILGFILEYGGDSNIQSSVSDYILFVVSM